MGLAAAAITVLKQIGSSPVISLTISSFVAVWVKLFHSRIDPILYSFSYNDCLTRQQWWRLFSAPCCHASFLQLIVNVVTLWGMRALETTYGSWFFLRYTLILLIAEALLNISLIHAIMLYTSAYHNFPPGQHPLRTLPTMGSSGILLSWVTFQLISDKKILEPFHFMGFIPIPWDNLLAPLFLIFVSSIIGSKTNAVTNIVCLASGFLLGVGVLKILPDFYWSICFIFDIAVFLLLQSNLLQSALISINQNNFGTGNGDDGTQVQGGDEDVIEVRRDDTRESRGDLLPFESTPTTVLRGGVIDTGGIFGGTTAVTETRQGVIIPVGMLPAGGYSPEAGYVPGVGYNGDIESNVALDTEHDEVEGQFEGTENTGFLSGISDYYSSIRPPLNRSNSNNDGTASTRDRDD
jgi:membrane associated rhomboid family serine protease